jgi:hypothetical protein
MIVCHSANCKTGICLILGEIPAFWRPLLVAQPIRLRGQRKSKRERVQSFGHIGCGFHEPLHQHAHAGLSDMAFRPAAHVRRDHGRLAKLVPATVDLGGRAARRSDHDRRFRRRPSIHGRADAARPNAARRSILSAPPAPRSTSPEHPYRLRARFSAISGLDLREQ